MKKLLFVVILVLALTLTMGGMNLAGDEDGGWRITNFAGDEDGGW